MTQDEAEAITLAVLRERKTRTRSGPVWSRRFEAGERHDPRSGWEVSVPLDVPDGWEEDRITVEVFEPDGEINIPMIL